MGLLKLAAALAILRRAEAFEKLGDGLLGGLRGVYGAASKGAKTMGAELVAQGHPLLGGVAKWSPELALAATGYGAYKSNPVQQAIYNYRVRKAQRQAQQGYY